MRSTFVAVLVLATVACSSLYPSARAETPPPAPSREASETRPVGARVARVEIVDDEGRALPTFAQAGRRFVLGDVGERYRIRIVNPTASRVEAIVSVDGLDVIDGRPAGVGKRGYLVPAFGDVTVDGWRTSMDTVAAFRFSSVRSSYAARTGRDQNVGVIGVAFFRERAPVVVRRALPAAPRKASEGAPPAAPAPAPSLPGAGAGAAAPRSAPADARPGLGTEYGEQHDSHVSEVSFERASNRPDSVFELRYDDSEGLIARGIRVPGAGWRGDENARRDAAQPFSDLRFAQPPR
jgi:hypothetical protein